MPATSDPLWPSAHDFSEAVQNPRVAFRNPDLRDYQPVLDRLGFPVVASGNFAYAFKLRQIVGAGSMGVRCFRAYMPDRDKRYAAIDSHLDTHTQQAASLSSFDFDPTGILVGGRPFPIVSMEWINGLTLDLYVEQIVGNKAAMLHLADQWVRVVESLRRAEIAHGDLQHGNIIIQQSQVKLIDFDGMYVPAMQGWQSSELGHQHYQHPRRTVSYFDRTLDNFSSLVIYLSIVSLSEAPELWDAFHDENLIFSKRDFVAPESSQLFEKVRSLGGRCREVALALEAASRHPPEQTPSLMSMVTRQSKLPDWMVQLPQVEITVKTREAPRVGSGHGRPFQQASEMGASSPPAASAYSGSGHASTTNLPVVASAPRKRFGVPQVIVGLLLGYVWILSAWAWPAEVIPWSALAAIIFVSVRSSRKKRRTGRSAQTTTTVPAPSGVRTRTNMQRRAATAQASTTVASSGNTRGYSPTGTARSGSVSSAHSTAAALSGSFVGSRIRSVYHRPSCEWARKISYRNQINFGSASDARAKGYRACGVCRP